MPATKIIFGEGVIILAKSAEYGTIAYQNARMAELMPSDYSGKIKRQMGRYQSARGTLTKSEIGALAVMQVLTDRLVEVNNQYDLHEVRLEGAAKWGWAEKQIERVRGNRNYRQALERA